jgi:uncharacterized protein YdeI (YjbR/CyaY-like superfamily)
MYPQVDKYFERARVWPEEMSALRTILLDCDLTEELKSGKPCYSFQEKNIAIIQGFKAYCALLFFKGVLLRDDKHLLVKTGEHTRIGRQIRFTSAREIVTLRPHLKAYLHEAVDIEKADAKVEVEKQASVVFPTELTAALKSNPALKKAFSALTPGWQRAYHLYFSDAKQAKTRIARIEKMTPRILKGKGINDR